MAGGIWVIGEEKAGRLARISTEIATLARRLGAEAGLDVSGVIADEQADTLAGELAVYLPHVRALPVATDGQVTVAAVAPALAALIDREQPAYVLLGATPDGRDLAGMLSALLGLGVLANATAVSWGANGPVAEMAIFGGRLLTTSEFTGSRGIVTVRPGAAAAEPLASPGSVGIIAVEAAASLPLVPVLGREAAATGATPIEDAKVVVAGGRGVGSAEGFAVVQALADALGGSVGASRAAVDSGWIDYSQQIGQTGKIVKPALYIGLGVSGAIQHAVGMQGAGTVIAVNKDAEAPIVAYADMLVVGDLFAVAPAIVEALKARA